jgi:hypothetical protein
MQIQLVRIALGAQLVVCITDSTTKNIIRRIETEHMYAALHVFEKRWPKLRWVTGHYYNSNSIHGNSFRSGAARQHLTGDTNTASDTQDFARKLDQN